MPTCLRIGKDGMEETDVIAKRCVVKKREIYLHLNDGRVFHFSAGHFPLLADARNDCWPK
jgi:hypothetical protein